MPPKVTSLFDELLEVDQKNSEASRRLLLELHPRSLVLLCHNFTLFLRAHTRGNGVGKLPKVVLGAIGS